MPRKRTNADFNEEIQAHIRIEADRLIADGVDPDEALAAARRAFGNVTSSRERFYESGRWMWFELLVRDIRQAFRQLWRSPVSTTAIILSLALGIGATTAVFSLADQAMLRTLPVAEPEQLVQLAWNGRFPGGGDGWGHLLPNLFFRDLREENEVFADVFAQAGADVSLAVGGESEPVNAEMVSGSYFPALGVRPALGRLFSDADDLQVGGHPLIVLSYNYWQSRFGGSPDVIGKQVRMNDHPMTVIGVAEQGFHGVDWSMAPSIWVPVMMKGQVTPGWNQLLDRRERFLHVFGRLKPGISREQAEAGLQPWFKAYLKADTGREGWPRLTEQQMNEYMASTLDLLPGSHGCVMMLRTIERPTLILLAAAVLILLLACLNVANLSLARTLTRRRVTALRTALGASRGRILTEQLIESALLAAIGCVLGVLLAPVASRAILSLLPAQGAANVALSASLDLRVLVSALVAAALATLIAGVAPAFYAASVQPVAALKQQAPSVAGGIGFRKALVVGQFALALILLIGAGLFVRTLEGLRARGPGFPTGNLLTFDVSPMVDGYGYEETKPLIRRLVAALGELPEVERAGAGVRAMLTGGSWNTRITIDSRERIVTEDDLPLNAVSPGFFETLGAPLRVGRDFDERDSREDTEFELRSAIVNEEFVEKYLQGADPIGLRVGLGDGPGVVADIEIVGVVQSFQDRGLREPEAQVFFPLWERGMREGTFYVRARSSSQTAARAIRAAVRQIDPKLTILSLRTIDDQVDRLLTAERILAALAGAFAAVATLLAMIGLFGVMSFSAARRTKEIGIRIALGAQGWAAGGLILREAIVLAATGSAIALPLCWALGRFVESQLFGVRPMDPATIAGAAAILAVVCVAASVVPARRAATVDPLEALRSE